MKAVGYGWGLILCAAICWLDSTQAAPVLEDGSHSLQLADTSGVRGGCYYNFEHYDEGDRIVTNEPCLNCTCHNRMLMCYLRVCPFTKAIGQDCTVEKKPDQCCPIITCPQVPVALLTSSTTSESPPTNTGLGRPDNYGCTLQDNTFYADGAQVPSDPRKPCELCYCIRNHTACVMQECTLNVEGCRPLYQEGICCPVRYDCDYEELATTPRPTVGLVTTPGGPSDCLHNARVYHDGEMVTKDERAPCEHCYCMRGDIVCAVQECGTPLEGRNCSPMQPKHGQCCPNYHCANGTISNDSHTADSSPSIETTQLSVEDESKEESGEEVEKHETSQEEISGESGEHQPTKPSLPEKDDSSEEKTTLAPETPFVSLGQEEQKPSSTEGYLETSQVNTLKPEEEVKDVAEPVKPVEGLETQEPIDSDSQETVTRHEETEASPLPTTTAPVVEEAARVPGEGSCLVDTRTYSHGAVIPTESPCQEECRCVSSIVTCRKRECPPPPTQYGHCIPIEVPGSCCPNYMCDQRPSDAPEVQNQVGIDKIDTFPDQEGESQQPEEAEKSETTTAFSAHEETSETVAPVVEGIPPDHLVPGSSNDLNGLSPGSTEGASQTEVEQPSEPAVGGTQVNPDIVHGMEVAIHGGAPESVEDKIGNHQSPVGEVSTVQPPSEGSNSNELPHSEKVTTLSPLADEELPTDEIKHEEPVIAQEESEPSQEKPQDNVVEESSHSTELPSLVNTERHEVHIVTEAPYQTTSEEAQHISSESNAQDEDQVGLSTAWPSSSPPAIEEVSSAAPVLDNGPSEQVTESNYPHLVGSTGPHEADQRPNTGLPQESSESSSEHVQVVDESSYQKPEEETTTKYVTEPIQENEHNVLPEEEGSGEEEITDAPKEVPPIISDDEQEIPKPSEVAPSEDSQDVPSSTEKIVESSQSSIHVPEESITHLPAATQDEPQSEISHDSNPSQTATSVDETVIASSESEGSSSELVPDNVIAGTAPEGTTGSPSIQESTEGPYIAEEKPQKHEQGQGAPTTGEQHSEVSTESIIHETNANTQPQEVGTVKPEISSENPLENVPYKEVDEDREEQASTKTPEEGLVSSVTQEAEKEVGEAVQDENVHQQQAPSGDVTDKTPTSDVSSVPEEEIATSIDHIPENSDKVPEENTSQQTSVEESSSSEKYEVPHTVISESSSPEKETTPLPGSHPDPAPSVQEGSQETDITYEEVAVTGLPPAESLATEKVTNPPISVEQAPVTETVHTLGPSGINVDEEKEKDSSAINEISGTGISNENVPITQQPPEHPETPTQSSSQAVDEPIVSSEDEANTISDHKPSQAPASEEPSIEQVSQDSNQAGSAPSETVHENVPLGIGESNNELAPQEETATQTVTEPASLDSVESKPEAESNQGAVPAENVSEEISSGEKNEIIPTKGETSEAPSEEPIPVINLEENISDSASHESTSGPTLAESITETPQPENIPQEVPSPSEQGSHEGSHGAEELPPTTYSPVRGEEQPHTTLTPDKETHGDTLGPSTVDNSVVGETSHADSGIEGSQHPEEGPSTEEEKPSTEERPITEEKPSTGERPSIEERPITEERPSTDEKPSAEEGPSTEQIPGGSYLPQQPNEETPVEQPLSESKPEHTQTEATHIDQQHSESSSEDTLLESPTTFPSEESSVAVTADAAQEVIPQHEIPDSTPIEDAHSEKPLEDHSVLVPSEDQEKHEPPQSETEKPQESIPQTDVSHDVDQPLITESHETPAHETSPNIPESSSEISAVPPVETGTQPPEISPGHPQEPSAQGEVAMTHLDEHSPQVPDSANQIAETETSQEPESVQSGTLDGTKEEEGTTLSQLGTDAVISENFPQQETSSIQPEVVDLKPIDADVQPSVTDKQEESFSVSHEIESPVTTGAPQPEEHISSSSETNYDIPGESSLTTSQEPIVAESVTEPPRSQEIPAEKPESSAPEQVNIPEKPVTISDDQDANTQPSENTSIKHEIPSSTENLPETSEAQSVPDLSKPSTESNILEAVPSSTQRPLTQGGPLFPNWSQKPFDQHTTTEAHSPEDSHYPFDSEYDEDDGVSYGPGTCRYGGKVYLSAQQIPRDDPCDFCFCFRSDIICLQQSCPPPIRGCYQETIKGFCCPRYECHVSMATMLNITTTTTTTTTTLPPHFFAHAYNGAATKAGCQVKGVAYSVGDRIPSTSGPCLECRCGANGQMKCDPTVCGPQEALLRQVMDAAVSRRRR